MEPTTWWEMIMASFASGPALGALVIAFIVSACWFLKPSSPCTGCSRTIPTEEIHLDFGKVFECAECGARNVVRPRASLPGWCALSVLVGACLWGAYRIFQFKTLAKMHFINVTFGQSVPSDDSTFWPWRVFVFAAVCVYLWILAFEVEEEPGPEGPPRL